MRFSIQPEPRQEQNMRTVTIEEILSACTYDPRAKPTLEYYFSPTKKDHFVKSKEIRNNRNVKNSKRSENSTPDFLNY